MLKKHSQQAATKIQAWARLFHCKAAYMQHLAAAITIQSLYRGHVGRMSALHLRRYTQQNGAARVIQKWWRDVALSRQSHRAATRIQAWAKGLPYRTSCDKTRMVDSPPKDALLVESSEAGWTDDLGDLDLEDEPVMPTSNEASDGWGEDGLDNLDCSMGDGEIKNLIVPLEDRVIVGDKAHLSAQTTNDESVDAPSSGWDDLEIDDVDFDELDSNQAVEISPAVAFESTRSTPNQIEAVETLEQPTGEVCAVDSSEAEQHDAKAPEDVSEDDDQPAQLSSTVAPAAVRLLQRVNESEVTEDSNKIPRVLKTTGALSVCEPSLSIVPEDSRLFDQVHKVQKTRTPQLPVAALASDSLDEDTRSRTKMFPQEDKTPPTEGVKSVAAAPSVTNNSPPRIRRHSRPDEEARYKAELERSVNDWIQQMLASNNDSASDVPCLNRYVSRAREARRRARLLKMPSLDS